MSTAPFFVYMKALKQIITRNIQNHAEVVIDLPPTGLIVFTGDNSNGKSVIVKAVRALVLNEIKKPRKRASLVNRKASYGEAIFIRTDDVILTMHVAREAASTWISLEVPGQDKIVRYLSDKSYTELVQTFGLQVAGESGISLNVAEADESLLFYKTPTKTNHEVLQIATVDSRAMTAATNMENTLSETRQFRDACAAQARTIKPALQELHIGDVEALTERRNKLFRYYSILSRIYIPTIPEIKAVPKVRITNVYIPTLPKIKWPKVHNIYLNVPDILPVANELKSVREGKCPTCGRGFNCDCSNPIHQ